jgi:hypothetical protein
MSGNGNGAATHEQARQAVKGAVVPPQNLDAEEAVLGAIMLPTVGAQAFADVVHQLAPWDFYRESHARIYTAVMRLVFRGDPVDAITLVDELEESGELEQVGGRARIHEIAALVPAAANARHYASIIREKAIHRALIRTGGEISRLGWDEQGDVDEKVARARHLLTEMLEVRPRERADSWLGSATELLARPDPGDTPFLVDRLIVDGALAFVVGRWKVGKTWALLELVLSIVTGRRAFGCFDIAQPGPVILILEESGEAAFHRRLDRLARGYAIRPDDLAELRYATNLGVRLTEARWQKRLGDAVAAIQPRALILDPWVRVKGAQTDEKEQREVALVLDFLLGLRDRYRVAIVVAAHQGHEGKHIRGSSDLEAVWESRLSLDRDAKTNEVKLTAEHREAEELDAFRYMPVFDGSTRTVRMQALDRPDAEDDAASARRAELRERILRVVDRDGDPSTSEIVDGAGARATVVRAEVDALVSEGGLVEAQLRLSDVGHTRRFARPSGTRPAVPDGLGRGHAGASSPDPSAGRVEAPLRGLPGGTGYEGEVVPFVGREP